MNKLSTTGSYTLLCIATLTIMAGTLVAFILYMSNRKAYKTLPVGSGFVKRDHKKSFPSTNRSPMMIAI